MESLRTESDKASIRQAMRARRKALAPEEKARTAETICAKLWFSNVAGERTRALSGDDGAVVAVYLASPDEIDLTDYIEQLLGDGIPVVAPRWNGETYELARLTGLGPEDLRTGPMGIREPVSAEETVAPAEVTVWIVPGLAFTRAGKRLGYGGGWYDRLMAKANRRALKIGVAAAFQVVDDLPSESHDIRLTHLVDDVLEDPHLVFEETAAVTRPDA